jgi:hypothetical protein
MYTGRHVKYRVLLPDFNQTLTFSKDFQKSSNIIKLDENPSSGNRVVFHVGRRTITTKLTVVHRYNEANVIHFSFNIIEN